MSQTLIEFQKYNHIILFSTFLRLKRLHYYKSDIFTARSKKRGTITLRAFLQSKAATAQAFNAGRKRLQSELLLWSGKSHGAIIFYGAEMVAKRAFATRRKVSLSKDSMHNGNSRGVSHCYKAETVTEQVFGTEQHGSLSEPLPWQRKWCGAVIFFRA